ncbi:MAG: outer membrane beta-barrel protein [Acidobacteria bacterium]|nr:outer membrane beta-barrel protein [Acidobacteriota bacterium]
MRSVVRFVWVSGLAIALPAPAWAQATGVVAGEVIDQNLAITLPGVPVEVVGSGEIAYTDLDGRYRFELPAGQHRLRIVMAGYGEQSVTVEVVEGRSSAVQVALASNVFAEEVTVNAPTLEAATSTAAAQLMMRMRAPSVQDNVGAIEMSANNDSNAADAMQRVTGVSVVEGQSVFVRGLGERYSNTTLAGATLPTTEPDRRVVPLDLFPTGLIDSVQVSKTYTPDKPSQFAGGLVEIVPLKLPDSTSFEISAGGGWNSLTTGTMGLGYPGGGRDWAGFDDGTRALPAGFPTRKVTRGGRFSGTLGYSRDDLERLGEQFANVWDPVEESLPLDQSYSALFGGRFGKLGIVATFRHAQGSQYTEEEQTFYKVGSGGAIERFNGPYDFRITERSGTVGGVGNVAYQFTPNQRLSFDNFYTHVGTNETRLFQGYNDDAGNDIRNQRLWWVEEQITSHHLGGEHLFPTLSNSRFDWKLAYSHADRREPDLREVLYESDPARQAFVLADESQSGLRQFNDLEDDTWEGSLNWSSLFEQWGGFASQVKLGGSYIDRSRDFQSRRLRFVPRNLIGGGVSGARNLSHRLGYDVARGRDIDLSRPAEELFTAAHIGDVFELKEETRGTDRYDAAQDVGSFYGMIDLPLSASTRLVTGARIETFTQVVETLDPFAGTIDQQTADVQRASLDETDIFPAVNFVYAVRSDQNVRLGYSQTVNRPEFREVSPFEFTDVVGGRAIVGNPDLNQSLIQNVDLRWEWFPGAEEVLSASVFYKQFDDPIERIVEPTAQLRTSFANADTASNVGLELEARSLIGPYVLVGANYTYVDSEVSLSPAARQVQTSLTRPLAGTSPNLFNAVFEVRGMGYSGRFLFNHFDDRISDVGSLGLPDIIEKGRHSLDFIFAKRFDRASLRIALTNLTDQAFEFTQGGTGPTQRIFNLGRSMSFGVTYRP